MSKSKGTIVITINTDGSFETEAHGFKGRACEDITDALLAGLGTKDDEGDTPDRWAPEPVHFKVQQTQED